MPPGVSTQMELDPVHKESIRICLWRSQAPLPVDDGTFLFRGLVFTLHPTLQCLNCGGILPWDKKKRNWMTTSTRTESPKLLGLFSSGVEVLRMC
ncbi:uncharacterized protein ACBT44_010473 isoform 2-T2 [Syngnathus typhle]